MLHYNLTPFAILVSPLVDWCIFFFHVNSIDVHEVRNATGTQTKKRTLRNIGGFFFHFESHQLCVMKSYIYFHYLIRIQTLRWMERRKRKKRRKIFNHSSCLTPKKHPMHSTCMTDIYIPAWYKKCWKSKRAKKACCSNDVQNMLTIKLHYHTEYHITREMRFN